MKKYAFALVVVLSALGLALPALAQGNAEIITLNDATPGIDVIVSTPPGATGVVALEIHQAAVSVVDSSGATVFTMADPRVHALELRLAPDAGQHTLTVTRLPGVTESYVRVTSLLDLSVQDQAQLVSAGTPLSIQQETDLPLSPANPGGQATVVIPDGGMGTLTASFPGAAVTAQVLDQAGQIVATLSGDRFDGLMLALDSGSYQVTLVESQPGAETVANIKVMPGQANGLLEYAMANSAPATDSQLVANGAAACAVTINVSSLNLRSGPGTGYSVMDYGFRGDQLQVGGVDASRTWLLVGNTDGSAWMSGNLGFLQGDCASLPVYDIPYREAQQPQVIVQQLAQQLLPQTLANTSVGFLGEHEDEAEHEGDDD